MAEDGQPWRPRSWTIETPGVRLERRGAHELLVGDGRPLRKVRIRVRPYTGGLRASYTPVLRFSDGALAHFDLHYQAAPLARLAERTLPSELDEIKDLDEAIGLLSVRDPGARLLVRGRVARSRISTTLGKRAGAYVYSGNSPILETNALAAVFDSNLPAWTRKELNEFTPRLLALYAERMGPPKWGRPMAIVAWSGPSPGVASASGSVLPGAVVMELGGEGLLQSSPRIVKYLYGFLGHETAHFWLGQTVHQARREDAWITEGGANLIALRGLEQLAISRDSRAELQKYLDDCLSSLASGRSLRDETLEGKDAGGHYTCGAMLFLAAEGAARGRNVGADAFTFVRRLIEANRSDGAVSTRDWLTAFEAETLNSTLSKSVLDLVENGHDNPADFFAKLFVATGVRHAREGAEIRLL